jgi:predicted TIM-barrel fold metal-dependent hydrolase
MIVDCHAHVFEAWTEPCGHPSVEIHLKYLQRMAARSAARAFRLRDGAPATTAALARGAAPGWDGLADVDFRVGRFGRLEFTVDGEDYALQYMPVGMQDLVAPPELMLAQMMNAGVDHAVLQAGGVYGAMTAMNAATQARYPAKFTGLMHVVETRAGEPDQLAIIADAAQRGLKGLYFNVEGLARTGFALALDDAALGPFWEALAARGLVLCMELNSGPSFDTAGYMRHLLALGRQLARHPGLKCHLAMGPPAAAFAANGRWEIPQEALAVYRRDNMVIEVMFPISWGGRWDYPYPEAQALIRGLRDLLGADRLVWGSDMPNVERFCTYKQSLDYVRRYCEFLTPREKDLILGGTCATFYGID